MRRHEIRWWGWGYLNKTYPLEDRPHFWPFLRDKLGLRGDESFPPRPLSEIRLREPRLPPQALAALRETLGEEGLSTSLYDRITHSFGKSYRDLVRLRRGEVDNPPDAVAYPQSEEQVASLLRLASEWGLAIVPFGGGTSVVGGVEPPEGDYPVLSLDLKRLNRLLSLDPSSLTAVAQPGMRGPELETSLNEAGYTLGHFPQSFEFSTLGGWIATRAAGQKSTGYGKIEDLVLSLRVVTPVGTFEARRTPASAAGPAIMELFIGSEGVLGVITRATLRIRPLPQRMEHHGLLFPDFARGLEALREMMQRDIIPTTARLSDPEETRAYLALRTVHREAWKRLRDRATSWLLNRLGYLGAESCLLILGFEGEEEAVRRTRERALALCKAHGGFHLGRGPGEAWYRERFELPYLRDVLLDHGIMVDTLETATTWDNLPRLYRETKRALEEAIQDTGALPWVMTHVSHLYPQGASLYYTFLGKQARGRELEQWAAVKKAATDRIMRCGGTLSHHHGVGLDHAPWMALEHGTVGLKALRALKQALDPYGVMNPGKLGL